MSPRKRSSLKKSKRAKSQPEASLDNLLKRARAGPVKAPIRFSGELLPLSIEVLDDENSVPQLFQNHHFSLQLGHMRDLVEVFGGAVVRQQRERILATYKRILLDLTNDGKSSDLGAPRDEVVSEGVRRWRRAGPGEKRLKNFIDLCPFHERRSTEEQKAWFANFKKAVKARIATDDKNASMRRGEPNCVVDPVKLPAFRKRKPRSASRP